MGTVFEWYDFFLFGTLASTIARNFTGGSESAGFIFALGAFAAGFFVRPFGALFFGRIGDRSGRKRAFLLTIVSTVMNGSLDEGRSGFLPRFFTHGQTQDSEELRTARTRA